MPYKDKEKYRQNQKKYRENNKEYFENYRLNNKHKKSIIDKKYRESSKFKDVSPLLKLRRSISSLLSISISKKGYTKKCKSYEILGCSYEEFKQHLERQFKKGMNWENRGQWHLDHIYPVSLAKDEQELIKLNHYTNFQPLWAIENRKKSNKIIANTQIKLI
jgi:hypothetical protein